MNKIQDRYFDENLNCYVTVCAAKDKAKRKTKVFKSMKEKAHELHLTCYSTVKRSLTNAYDLAVNFDIEQEESDLSLADIRLKRQLQRIERKFK